MTMDYKTGTHIVSFNFYLDGIQTKQHGIDRLYWEMWKRKYLCLFSMWKLNKYKGADMQEFNMKTLHETFIAHTRVWEKFMKRLKFRSMFDLLPIFFEQFSIWFWHGCRPKVRIFYANYSYPVRAKNSIQFFNNKQKYSTLALNTCFDVFKTKTIGLNILR